MNNSRAWTISAILFLTALFLVLCQHWGLSFTNADDPWISQLGIQGSISEAKRQGRFWLIPITLLMQIPYLFDSWAIVNITKIAVNGFTLLSFVLFCSKLGNKHTGILIGLVWLALIDISPSNYSPIHGYLLMFNLQFAFLFMSLYSFIHLLERNDPTKIIVTPYLLFAFAILAYEPMFFYSMAFPALYLYKQNQEPNITLKFSFSAHVRKFLSKNFTLVIVLILYVLIFFGFRKVYETPTIRGIDLGGNLIEALSTIYRFSIYGFHIQLKPFNGSILEVYSRTTIFFSTAYAVLISLGLFFILPRIKDELVPSTLYQKRSLLVLGFFIFSPNILFGLVEGYRKWAANDPHYVGNYFSSFPLAIAIALLLIYLVGGKKSQHEKILFLLILSVFFISSFNNYLRWGNLAEINRRGTILWEKTLKQLNQESFDPHRQNLLCAINAPKQYITGDDQYWSKYLSQKYSTDILYSSNKVSTASCDLVLNFNKIP